MISHALATSPEHHWVVYSCSVLVVNPTRQQPMDSNVTLDLNNKENLLELAVSCSRVCRVNKFASSQGNA